ncbi:flagellar hook-associated protein FlgK [Fulvimonas sp. R45]|uniref:flagellar hook-associated protein FlgK n=1 Tax=Fulvimonas sp. R45 TaxID=3045937 RepID=UPI00265DCC23|nr:flagellar hook-associated protein FlgK [Fulvimonas sp. R45]MDO1528344.1 flagellar hook-associated protein FlgK [Fulvimonas sp. R45]
MANLLSTGISGLSAAQLALNVVGNNIANVDTPGYSRQSTVQADRVGTAVGGFTIGGGVDVTAVERAYSRYLTTAMWSSHSGLQGASTGNALAGALNGMFTGSGNLQTALDGFYGAFGTLAGAPGDASQRQALLGKAAALVANFNTLGQQLDLQRKQVNTQVAQTVDSINAATAGIARLNQQIAQASAGSGAPNALLDQRDALVNTLSGYLGITTAFDSDGSLSVYSASGQNLVSGVHASALSAGGNAYDASTTDVFDGAGNDITGTIGGGTLGALLNYRGNVLAPAQNQLGLAALGLAASVNGQQAKGLDLHGRQGAAMFTVPSPAVAGARGNQGDATVAASVDDVAQLTGADYVLGYDGSQWRLATTGGQSVPLTANPDGSLSAAGLRFTVSGDAQAGDSYRIAPSRDAAGGLALALSDPSGIAAAAALVATPGSGNTGAATVGSVAVTDTGAAGLLDGATVTFTSASDYAITDAGGTLLASGSYTPGQPIAANGWRLTLGGTPAAGDSFAVTANTAGLDDNGNALALGALDDAGVLDGGKTSIMDAYAGLTTQVGDAGSQAQDELATQTALNNQAVSAQQSVSGVNLDEEAASMVRYQQAYQASAQIISTAQSIFSSLIDAIRS